MKRQSQSVPNLNQEEDNSGAPKETAKQKKEKKKQKRLSKSFWNLFSPSTKDKSERSSETSVTERFGPLTEEGEDELEEERDLSQAHVMLQ